MGQVRPEEGRGEKDCQSSAGRDSGKRSLEAVKRQDFFQHLALAAGKPLETSAIHALAQIRWVLLGCTSPRYGWGDASRARFSTHAIH